MKSYKKYSKENLFNYINGNDIDNIDELENNPNFMLEVIKLTQDKKMFFFCGDELKKDPRFIEQIYLLFKDDLAFALDLYDLERENFLENVDIMNLAVMISNNFDECELIKDQKLFGRLVDLKVALGTFYAMESFRFKSEALEDERRNKKYEGIGFFYVMHLYKDYPLIKDYFASVYVQDICYEEGYKELERYLHKTYKYASNITKIGVKKFTNNYLFKYDEYLAGYVEGKDLAYPLEKLFSKILQNWDKFDHNRNETILDIIEDYVFENVDGSLLRCTSDYVYVATFYIKECFQIPELMDLFAERFGEYQGLDENLRETFGEPSEDEFLKNALSLDELQKIRGNVSKYLETLDDGYKYIDKFEEEKKEKNKIVQFKQFKTSSNEK